MLFHLYEKYQINEPNWYSSTENHDSWADEIDRNILTKLHEIRYYT